jgi:hypothetical protein
MSRTLAAVIGLTLGAPIAAMIAISVASGVDPEFLMSLLVGGVVTAFIVCAIFEIKRLADPDSDRNAPERHTVIADDALAPVANENVPLPLVLAAADISSQIVVPASAQNASEQREPTVSEPTVVEPTAKIAVAPKTKSRAKPRPSKPSTAPDASASEAGPVAAKGKRKPTQRKPVTAT